MEGVPAGLEWHMRLVEQIVDAPLPGGVNPGGGVSPREVTGTVSEGETKEHGGKTVPCGSHLTPERLAEMKIGDGFLPPEEKQLFMDILFEFEGVLSFDDSEMGLSMSRSSHRLFLAAQSYFSL